VNGIHFTDPGGETRSPSEIKEMIARWPPFRAHAFEPARARNDTDPGLTKPKDSFSYLPARSMDRTITNIQSRSNSWSGLAGIQPTSRSRSHLDVRGVDGFAHSTTSFDATVESALSV
jgi:hypothetical protein